MTREQESYETPQVSQRVKKRHAAKEPPRLDQVPALASWLATIPFSLILSDAAKEVGLRRGVRAKKKEKEQNCFDYHVRALKEMSLPGIEALRDYVHEKYRRACKASTLRNTVVSCKAFLLFLQRRGKESLEQLTREDLEAYVEREQDRGLKPCTVKSELAIVYAFIAHVHEHGVVDSNVLVRRIRVKLPESLPRAMDPQDLRRLLSVLDDTRNRALILVLLRTGMRIGELLGTQVRDVNLEERRIQIPQAPKTAVGRVVYLSDDAREALRVWLAERDRDEECLFYAHGSITMEYAAARAVFVKALGKAGLAGSGYTLHCLRHTFASEMLNAGMRLECLQQLLGHTSVNVTRRYARLTDTTREEEYFRAMELIEKGGIHGHYQLDPELQAVLEEKKLLRTHAHALSERP
jgi:integrase/recombinase XerD